MDDPAQRHLYASTGFSLDEDVPSPSYSAILDWMNNTSGRAFAFDIWARGNYARRVIANRRAERSPVLVPFTNLREMRWAYRRLSLMGLPSEFIYTGHLSSPKKVLTLHPAGDYIIDAGWGYVAALGSIVRIAGRDWFPVLGYSRPMPEVFLDWITKEVPNAFLRGDLFIASAPLVGIDPLDFAAGSKMMSEIHDGSTAVDESKAVEVIAQLELPHLDGLSPLAFEKLLLEHADDLVRFRLAVRKLVHGTSIDDAIEEIRAEVADMCYSDKNRSFRNAVARFGGVFTTFAAAVGATAAAVSARVTPEVALTAVGSAALAGAASVLSDVWKQAAERRVTLRSSRLSLLWDLGMQSAASVRKSGDYASLRRYNRIEPASPGSLFDDHWLCPPSNGMGFLAVRETIPSP